MKISHALILPIILFAFACKKKIFETITFHSPEGINQVLVSGERPALSVTMKVKVTVKIPAGEKTFFVELSNSRLDSSNVKMEWESEDKGVLTMYHSDNEAKVMHMNLSGNKIHVIQDLPR